MKRRTQSDKCTAGNCERRSKSRSLCERHYKRLKKYGDALKPVLNHRLRHGHSVGGKTTSLYRTWAAMAERCHNPRSLAFKDYGARGIVVCDEWRRSFTAFYAFMGERPSPNHSIDRIENNRGYEPGNVRWATDAEQRRNRTDNVFLTVNGVTKCSADWADEVGLRRITLCSRLKKGWPAEKAVLTPVRPHAPYPKRITVKREAKEKK